MKKMLILALVLTILGVTITASAQSSYLWENLCPSGQFETEQQGSGLIIRCLNPVQPTPTAPPAPTATPIPPTPPASGAIIIDHDDVTRFNQIPEAYINSAKNLSVYIKNASVGSNLSFGLDCLAGNANSLVNGRRKWACDVDTPLAERVVNSRYDRSRWSFNFFSSSGWDGKTNEFLSTVNAMPAHQYNYVGYKFCYLEIMSGSSIDDLYFSRNPNDAFPGINNIEALESRQNLIFWTSALARSAGTTEATSYNRQMREYAAANGKVLFDLADILSHHPNGSSCVNTNGEANICDEYTNESQGGHLNSYGALKVAQAYWVLMARLAGWQY